MSAARKIVRVITLTYETLFVLYLQSTMCQIDFSKQTKTKGNNNINRLIYPPCHESNSFAKRVSDDMKKKCKILL